MEERPEASAIAIPSPEKIRELEARIAALEAGAWAANAAAVEESFRVKELADAACQAALEDHAPVRGPLLRNLAASRAGVAGRFEVTHLIVPTALLRDGVPRCFCGWAFADCKTLSFDGDLTNGDACEGCLPGLHKRLVERRARVAARTARIVASADLPAGEPPDPGGNLEIPERGAHV